MDSSPPLGTSWPAGEDVRTPEGGPGNTKEYPAVRARQREHTRAKVGSEQALAPALAHLRRRGLLQSPIYGRVLVRLVISPLPSRNRVYSRQPPG